MNINEIKDLILFLKKENAKYVSIKSENVEVSIDFYEMEPKQEINIETNTEKEPNMEDILYWSANEG